MVDITDIIEDDEYGGNKYHIVGKLQSLKVNLEIDISTGDKVTSRELKYKYASGIDIIEILNLLKGIIKNLELIVW